MEIDKSQIEKINEVKIEYFEQYFGASKEYYLSKLIDLENGKKFSLNISALLFGIFWFLYRRLYIHSLTIFLVVIIESKIENILLERLGDTKDLEILLRFISISIFGLLLGFLGNYYFLKQSIRRVKNIISYTFDEKLIMLKLKKSGSGNWILVLSIVSIFILALFFGQK
jgi:hypothetical protein